MTIDVSVVVPFFNPGANIEDCLASLAGQTISPERFEVVLVDDGSTDGSDLRVNDWVRRYSGLMRMHRIAASGGPARPRNIAIEHARGRYVQFLDSDDTLAPLALERQMEVADSSAADVVVGKLSSDFRGIWQPLFRRTVTGKTISDYPLIQNLTVCKMFRRDFLNQHAIRFPEGPHYIEDQQICIQAYAHATSVAVIGDLTCYFYRRRRTGGRNFGDTPIVPADYYRELAAIFDVIDTRFPADARVPSLSRYYRDEMLGRLRGTAMLSYDSGYRRQMLDEVRHLATTRMPPEVHEQLPMFIRPQSRMMLDDDVAGLLHYAEQLESVRLSATTVEPRWQDGRLEVTLDAYFRLGDEPLQLEPYGEDWALPESMAPGVAATERRLGGMANIDVDLATISRSDSQHWSTTDGLSLRIDEAGTPRVRCEAVIDPGTVMGGGPLTAGLWDVRLRVMLGGLTRGSLLRPATGEPASPTAWLTESSTSEVGSVQPYWTHPSPSLALDVDEWLHALPDLTDDSGLPTPRVVGRRGFELDLPWLCGPLGTSRRAQLILDPPADHTTLPLVVGASLSLRPDGSTLVASIPRLPGPGSWRVRWRVGELGGAPSRELPVELGTGRFGGLTATLAATEPAESTGVPV